MTARTGSKRSKVTAASVRPGGASPVVATDEAAGGGVPVDRTPIVAAATELARPIAEARGAVIDRVEFRRSGGRGLLQVFIDSASGVTIDDCARVSRELSAALEVEDVVSGAYTLEVSSPGLDRPLSDRADFERFADRLVSLTVRGPVEGKSKIVGVLRGLADDDVIVEDAETGREVRVALSTVARARLEIDA